MYNFVGFDIVISINVNKWIKCVFEAREFSFHFIYLLFITQ